jgi:hypothetical protein
MEFSLVSLYGPAIDKGKAANRGNIHVHCSSVRTVTSAGLQSYYTSGIVSASVAVELCINLRERALLSTSEILCQLYPYIYLHLT